MDVRYINPFLTGTINVLKTMAAVDPTPGKPYLKKNSLAVGDVSGIIGLTGSVAGSMALSFSEKAILKIVSNMLGEELTEVNGDIADAVGEITNMVSGASRKEHGCDPYGHFGEEPFDQACSGWAQFDHSF